MSRAGPQMHEMHSLEHILIRSIFPHARFHSPVMLGHLSMISSDIHPNVVELEFYGKESFIIVGVGASAGVHRGIRFRDKGAR